MPNRVKAAFKGQTPHWDLSALVTLPRASVGRGGFGSEAKPASYVPVSAHVGQRAERHGREFNSLMLQTGFEGWTQVFLYLYVSCTRWSEAKDAHRPPKNKHGLSLKNLICLNMIDFFFLLLSKMIF